MTSRKPLIILAGAVVILALVTLIAAPLAVATALRISIARTARQHGLAVTFGNIEAPLLRPVVMRNVKISSAQPGGVALEIERAQLDLRLAAWFDPSRGRVLRNLSVDGLRGEIRRTGAPRGAGWRSFRALLADDFDIAAPSLKITAGGVVVELQQLAISGSELESGTAQLRSLAIRGPLFQHEFRDLRAATSWQLDRLTIGGIALMRGFDVDVLTLDFARMAEDRAGIEANADLFGGKLRLSMSTEEEGAQRIWDIVASGTEISLGRMSDALAFENRASGSVHAFKLTFRGSFFDLSDATASLWTEATGATWRDRTADTIMLGASLYSRQVQIEQLYVKQRKNQLTLSGETELPRTTREWPDFRGDISAAIGDLGEFARLFGASAGDFAGQLNVDGAITETGRKFTGQIVTTGSALTLFNVPVEALDARILVGGATAKIDGATLRQNGVALELTGQIESGEAGTLAIRLQSKKHLRVVAPPSCVSELTLAAGPSPAAGNAPVADRFEFSGPLLEPGWKVTVSDTTKADAAPNVLPFCADDSADETPLTLSPVEP